MPDGSRTREWSVVPEGGPDERARELEDVGAEANAPTREYAPQPEGGPDEHARADENDEGFKQRVENLAAVENPPDPKADEAAIRKDLLKNSPAGKPTAASPKP